MPQAVRVVDALLIVSLRRRLRHQTWTRPGGPGLFLPKSWIDDRDRCRAAHIPDERAFATRPHLAKAMVLRAIASPLRIAWVPRLPSVRLRSQNWRDSSQ